jgi:hypothetical protein
VAIRYHYLGATLYTNQNAGSSIAAVIPGADYEDTITGPPIPEPTRLGYLFDDWHAVSPGGAEWIFGAAGTGTALTTAAGVAGAETLTPTLELHAKWIPTYWDLDYDVNLPPGSEQPEAPIALPTVNAGPISTASDSAAVGSPIGGPKRTDGGGYYSFDGWATTATGAVAYTSVQTVPAQTAGTTVALFAVWSYTATYWDLTYSANLPADAA